MAAFYAPFIALVFIVFLVRFGFASMRCYERGISYSTLLRKRAYRYEDLSGFTYGPQKTENGGVIDPNHIEFVLEPIGARKRDFIKFSDNIKSNATSMQLLRNAVARAMAPPLAERVMSGLRLSWPSQLCFEGDRVIFDLTSVPERYVSLHALEQIDFVDDEALVYVAGLHGPLKQLDTQVRNFYPILFCVDLLRQRIGAKPLFAVDDDGEFYSAR